MQNVNPFFEVVKVPLVLEGAKTPLKNRFGLVNQDNGECLGVVSGSYEIIPNKNVYDTFKDAFGVYQIKEQKHHLDQIGRWWKCDFLFEDDKLQFEVNKADIVGVAMRLFNGYDGRNSFGYEVFGYRYICENGSIMGKRGMFSRTYTHFPGNVEQLQKDFQVYFPLFQNIVDTWGMWNQTPMDLKQFEAFLEDKKYLGKKMAKRLAEAHPEVLNKYKMDETMWGSFNVISYIATHETKARKGSNVFSHGYNTLVQLMGDFFKLGV